MITREETKAEIQHCVDYLINIGQVNYEDVNDSTLYQIRREFISNKTIMLTESTNIMVKTKIEWWFHFAKHCIHLLEIAPDE